MREFARGYGNPLPLVVVSRGQEIRMPAGFEASEISDAAVVAAVVGGKCEVYGELVERHLFGG